MIEGLESEYDAVFSLRPHGEWREFSGQDEVTQLLVKLRNAIWRRETGYANTPRGAVLRRIAMAIGKLSEEHADDVVHASPTELMTISGKFPLLAYGTFCLAWMAYYSEAERVLGSIEHLLPTLAEASAE